MSLTFHFLFLQLFVLKHENEMISNAEKEARKMLHSLSQRLYCLQVMVVENFIAFGSNVLSLILIYVGVVTIQNEMESGVAERKKQEEYIQRLLVHFISAFPRNK